MNRQQSLIRVELIIYPPFLILKVKICTGSTRSNGNDGVRTISVNTYLSIGVI